MDYDLKCEGFLADDELEERLLLDGRRLVIAAGPCRPVRMILRQIEGRIQARVEVLLSSRRLTAVVWRFDPESALAAAVDVLLEALDTLPGGASPAWRETGSFSTLQ